MNSINSNRTVDHLVYCVPNLDEAVDWFEEQTGVRPVIGGRHLTKGTKNALMNLGNKCYLELIAVDHENIDFVGDRWMGLDGIETSTMCRWSLKTNDLESDSRILKSYNAAMGVIEGGERQTSDGKLLHWQMTLPLATPVVEVMPFFTDWSSSAIHPTDNLPELCQLKSLTIYHPQPALILSVFEKLSISDEVLWQQNPAIIVEIETPNGLLTLK